MTYLTSAAPAKPKDGAALLCLMLWLVGDKQCALHYRYYKTDIQLSHSPEWHMPRYAGGIYQESRKAV